MHRYDPEKTVADEEIIKEIDNWTLSISKSKRRIYINATEYHPFPLELSRDDLQGLLDAIDKMT
jgi:hypothetical protein